MTLMDFETPLMTYPEDQSDDSHLKRLVDEGRFFLNANQIDKAILTYVRILRKYPYEIGSLLALGDTYLVSGNRIAAAELYQEAAILEPDRRDIERRVKLALEMDSGKFDFDNNLSALSNASVARLIQALTGKSFAVSEMELEQAAKLLDETIHSSSPAVNVAENLDAIDTLLPALIELNVRQARANGQLDLVRQLENMQAEIIGDKLLEPVGMSDNPGDEKKDPGTRMRVLSILVVGMNTIDSPHRLGLIGQGLADCGHKVDVFKDLSELSWDAYDVVIAHNPHANPLILKGLASRAAHNLPTIVDLDYDFRQMNVSHPDFSRLGLGNPATSRAYKAALELAGHVTVAGEASAAKLVEEGYQVSVIPDSWWGKNPFWQRNAPPRATLNIGIFSDPGQVEAVATVRRSVIRILREFPQTRLVIGGDPQNYHIFDSLPDVRRLFLPPADAEDYPYLLAQADILIMPMVENSFNAFLTDRKFMEAGIRKIPWIASQTPASLEWGKGGMIANSIEEWYSHLHLLVKDRSIRQELGMEGSQKAVERESQKVSLKWIKVIQSVLPENQA
jgi:glycosyltransferase involved in cell wall biosynthesis